MALASETRILTENGFQHLFKLWIEGGRQVGKSEKYENVLLNAGGSIRASDVWLVAKDEPVICIDLCVGTRIRCTLDQCFKVVRNDEHITIPARHLIAGDLLPFVNNGYESKTLDELKSLYCCMTYNEDGTNSFDIFIPNRILYVEELVEDLLVYGIISKIVELNNRTVLRVSGDSSMRKLCMLLSIETNDLKFADEYSTLMIKAIRKDGTANVYDIATENGSEVCAGGIIVTN